MESVEEEVSSTRVLKAPASSADSVLALEPDQDSDQDSDLRRPRSDTVAQQQEVAEAVEVAFCSHVKAITVQILALFAAN